jgi:hypothetical protein
MFVFIQYEIKQVNQDIQVTVDILETQDIVDIFTDLQDIDDLRHSINNQD